MSKVEKETKEEVVKAEVTKETKKKLTPEQRQALKDKFRRAELQYGGRLVIDEKYKKPGKVLRVDNDDPATRKYLENLGYTIVQEDIKVGSGSLSEASNMGSAVHIEQGIVHSQPGILYEIDEEILSLRREMEAEDNDRILQTKIEENQGHLDK